MFSINTVTDVRTGLDHFVTASELERGQERRPCSYVAVCGAVFVPAALVQPPSGRCSSCIRNDSQSSVPGRSGPTWRHRLLGRIMLRKGFDEHVQERSARPRRP